jgi:hypothetical protein
LINTPTRSAINPCSDPKSLINDDPDRPDPEAFHPNDKGYSAYAKASKPNCQADG